ncbi:MAG: hypothetical protein M3Y33_08710 [Actinomycetota bacterium]|nr:hypothetical protein [Actinomycetota bacterium]
MSARFMHPSYGDGTAPSPSPAPERPAPTAAPGGIDWHAIQQARSCCCPASPAVVAIMPPAAGRPRPTELLLCLHHYRESRRALAEAGAIELDINGPRLI